VEVPVVKGEVSLPVPKRIETPREMNTSEGALKVAIHRLRKRYRELYRQEIADTVADAAEVESELRYLAAVLTSK
jgi:RNA polymerase sigma-70 factor (ECF subfamily)